MVAVTFFTQFLCMGFLFYSFGVVLKPLASEFGGGRLGVTMLPLAMSLGGALMAPIIGRWVAAGSIRNIMAIGCVCTGLGFLAGAHASALWQLMVLYGTLLSFGAGTMGGLTAQALVVNWFEDNRTMALGASLSERRWTTSMPSFISAQRFSASSSGSFINQCAERRSNSA